MGYDASEYYVAEGQIDVTDFVPDDIISAVKEVATMLNTKMLNEIQSHLSDVDYQDIRFVLAAMEAGY